MVKKKFTRIGSLFMTAVFVMTGTFCMGTAAVSAANSDTEPSGSGGATAVLNNEAGWSTCNVYYWGNGGGVKNADWPGKKLSDSDKNAEGFYEVQIDSQYLSGSNGVIFNNGSEQSADLSIAEGDCKVYNNKTKSWTDYDSNQLKLSFSTDLASPQYKGTNITLNANASGGSGSLTYTFKANSTTIATGTNSTATWTPTAAGTYTLSVEVKDTAGNTNSKSVTYEIKDDSNATEPILKGITTGNDDNTGVVNTNVPLTVNAAGGKIGTNLLFYKVAVTDPDGGAVNTVYYKQTNVLNFTPSKTGKYTVDVTVQNSYNTTVNNKYTVEILSSGGNTYTKPTVSAFTANPTTVEKGNAVKLSTTVANGLADYTYTYQVNGSTVKTNTSSSKTNTYSWTPSEAGTYTLKVTVKDAKGNSATKSISSYTVTEPAATDAPVISSATVTPISAEVNTAVAIKTVVKSGTGTPNFKYTFKVNDTTVKTATNISARSYTYNWTPTEAGTYKIEVVVNDANSKRASKVITSTFKVTKATNDTVIESFTAEKTKVGVAETIGITTKVKSGTGTPDFRYVIKINDERVYSFTTSSRTYTYDWTPMAKGNYKFEVVVFDASGKNVHATINNIKVVANPNPVIEYVDADKSSANVGDTVAITTQVLLGTGTPKFKYTVRIDGVSVKTATTTSKTFVYNWVPTETGTYKIEILVHDANGTLARKVLSNQYKVTYTAPVISSATLSKSSANVGDKVTVITMVKDGTGAPDFKYTVKVNDTTVSTAKDIKARSHSYTWTPTAAGTYKIQVIVNDSQGGRASKVITSTYKVTKAGVVSGDVTGDGKVTSADVSYVMGYVGGDTTNYPIPAGSNKFKAADVNNDGAITIDDAIIILGMC